MVDRAAAPYLHLSPRSAPGVDLRHYPISPQEAFLWSRLDGRTTLAQLADIAGLGVDVCMALLDGLAQLGLVQWPDDVLPQRAAVESAATAAQADLAALHEPGDLTPPERANILKLEQSLAHLNHWELLGVNPDTPAVGLKKAYHHASKLYHPDRYFGKNLGSFRDRLERIFDAIKKAYDVLADPQTATLYRQKHPPRGHQPAPVVALPDLPPPDPAHEQAMEQHRQSIIAQRKERERLKAAPVQGQTSRAQALVDQAEADLIAGRHPQAARAFALASDMLPAQSEHAVRAAQSFSLSEDFVRARIYVDRALAMAPRRKELQLLAADIAELAGDAAAALHYLTAAASLDPTDPHVKHWIGRLSRK